MMSNNFFEIKNVDFNVSGKTKVKNVSFSIENEGDIICLLGPSGIGKTTILRTIAGLQNIDKGSIELRGKTLSSKKINIEPENRNVSLAFQENSLFPHLNVFENLKIGQLKRTKEKVKLSLEECIEAFFLKSIGKPILLTLWVSMLRRMQGLHSSNSSSTQNRTKKAQFTV